LEENGCGQSKGREPYRAREIQVHHDSEKVQAELERIQDVIWQAYENYAQRPEPERSDPSDID
jgi:hypothetical protein